MCVAGNYARFRFAGQTRLAGAVGAALKLDVNAVHMHVYDADAERTPFVPLTERERGCVDG